MTGPLSSNTASLLHFKPLQMSLLFIFRSGFFFSTDVCVWLNKRRLSCDIYLERKSEYKIHFLLLGLKEETVSYMECITFKIKEEQKKSHGIF